MADHATVERLDCRWSTCPEGHWGPLADQLLHFSFGSASHFLILRDQVQDQMQGAVVPLPGEFRSGVHRGRFSPIDGQLYVSGMQGWGSYSVDDGCFQRVRYTGQPVQLPVGFHVHENGVAIDFSLPLDRAHASNADNHFAQCWNYRYSSGYGSAEFSSQHEGVRGHDVLPIVSAHVLDDDRQLFLEIPDLQPVNQLHLRLQSATGTSHDLFVTVHRLDQPFTEFPGYRPSRKTISPHPLQLDLARVTKSVPNPHLARIDNARRLLIETGTNLSYKTRTIVVRAGEPIQLTLANPDVVPHNWALIQPGTLQQVGELANRLISDPEASIRHYIPDSTAVLAYTDVVLPGEEFTIYFRAPRQPGRYPYLCTFPGHWMVMNGELIVEAAGRQ
jgi:azurin